MRGVFVTSSSRPSPDARPQAKIKQQVKKLRYPIEKPDICRIQKSLRAVKESLDLALQNLELNYSYDLLDQLQQNNTTVIAALAEEDPGKAIYKLAYKPSNLAAVCASLEKYFENAISNTANVLQTAPIAETSSCPCRRHMARRTKRISWLPWGFWDDEILYFEHYKGCKTGAGGQSLGAKVEYRATVDRMVSPAFCVISVLKECAEMLYFTQDDQKIKVQAHWESLALFASHKLECRFRLGKASAKDVDLRNQSLLHAAAEVVMYSLPMAYLVTLLVKRQVSASLLDLKGRQALAIAMPRGPLSISLAEAFYPYDADIHPQDLAQTFSSYATMLRVADVKPFAASERTRMRRHVDAHSL
ncbi:hypothetical protein V8C34DRAFT_317782 [Trichoderma compactum]